MSLAKQQSVCECCMLTALQSQYVRLMNVIVQGVRNKTVIVICPFSQASVELSGSLLVCSKYRLVALITRGLITFSDWIPKEVKFNARTC